MAASEVISFGPYRLIPAERLLLKEGEVVNVGALVQTLNRSATVALRQNRGHAARTAFQISGVVLL